MVTALYRRYRPETFAEMIGQSQVTEPLMTALRTDRVNHAYLFSGPRGCGKTTSARILARCLNCAEGPTDVPCGVCPSCVELARGGSGSLDVVEIDAASHNGVDDARDLRERAVFAPARDRYKIFILDEAHMVTPQGFNALLKLVEEPPEHVKFIFATTEPDKVLGTIRSRTHHYPFRLVPPGPMLEYVQQLCTEEGIEVAPGVLPLVVRAGGGSPRDTLSLLDQLIAGSEGTTIDYERAVALLGYTHGALLDEVVDAIGAKDAAGAFAAADRVVQTGQDPRRFVEDLLERLRDLIVVAASSPETAAAVLRGVPADELARMAAQAAAFGSAELSRVADLVNQTLTEMTGATSPRLHLELMLARVLVPSSDDSERGALARVERLERRIGVTDAAGDRSAVDAPVAVAEPARPPAVSSAPARVPPFPPTSRVEPASAAAASSDRDEAAARGPAAEAPASGPATDASAAPAFDAPVAAPAGSGAPAAAASAVPAPAPRPVGPVTLQQMRDAWPEVLASLQRTKRSAWMVAFTAQVREFRDGEVLVLAFPSEQDVAGFRGGAPGQSVSELLRSAINEVLGVTVKFIAKVEGATRGDAPVDVSSSAPEPSAPAPAPAPSAPAPSSAPEGRSQAPVAGPAAASGGAPSSSGAPASRASAARQSAVTAAPAAPNGPVDSWATVAIPADDPVEAPRPAGATNAAAGASSTSAATRAQDSASAAPVVAPVAVAVAERPGSAPDSFADIPDDADAPPEDEEPPFDPGPPPEIDLEPVVPAVPDAAPARRAPRSNAARGASAPPPSDGIQRYGEAVVREVLGATFLEEVEAPARPGFGERG
ncbi:DNA polymerase-3 subunit gamma/tau [Agromyces sp. 3263]|uniref:DNA polymerase III subunit gamma and tau n=1 Tax=Agromyces sp. 3263 TaxID=2817750 RepID=UPI002855E872|nr:DNA polymerase III subunit gamma and tau [Agromyces sp. 3263]MDR6904847.1 DNA polymerase-3 subunit gamma/tau [Agromyces sp. 3263]